MNTPTTRCDDERRVGVENREMDVLCTREEGWFLLLLLLLLGSRLELAIYQRV